MKIWIEYGRGRSTELTPETPRTFSTVENLLEYWKRTRFPADDVDDAYERFKHGRSIILRCGWGECERFAKEVEVDSYFVEREKNVSKKR